MMGDMPNIPAPDLDKLRTQTGSDVAAVTVTAVHIAYLTAAAVETADSEAREYLQQNARVWLESYDDPAPIAESYLLFLRKVMGETWQPGVKWQKAITTLG